MLCLFSFLCHGTQYNNRTKLSAFDDCSDWIDLYLDPYDSNYDSYFPPFKVYKGLHFEANSPKCFRIEKGFIIGLVNENNAQVSILGRTSKGITFQADADNKPFGASCPDDETCDYIITATAQTDAFIGYGIYSSAYISEDQKTYRETFLVLKDNYSCSIGTYARLDDNYEVKFNQIYTILANSLEVTSSEYAQIIYYDYLEERHDDYKTDKVTVSNSLGSVSFAYPEEFRRHVTNTGQVYADEYKASGTFTKTGTSNSFGSFSNWPDMAFVVENGKVFSKSPGFVNSVKTEPTKFVDDDGGLSAGAIAGIVIAVVVVVGVVVFCIIWFVVLKKGCGKKSGENPSA